MRRVEFIYFEAGGGHRSAATALKAVSEQQGRPWSIRLFNMQRELESLDIFKKIFRIRFEDIYNRMLAKGWTLGSEYLAAPHARHHSAVSLGPGEDAHGHLAA